MTSLSIEGWTRLYMLHVLNRCARVIFEHRKPQIVVCNTQQESCLTGWSGYIQLGCMARVVRQGLIGSSVHLRGIDRSVTHVFHARSPPFSWSTQPLCIPAPGQHAPPAHRLVPSRSHAVSARLLMSFDVGARPICARFQLEWARMSGPNQRVTHPRPNRARCITTEGWLALLLRLCYSSILRSYIKTRTSYAIINYCVVILSRSHSLISQAYMLNSLHSIPMPTT